MATQPASDETRTEPQASEPRSRRSLLAALAGGVAATAAAAIGRPLPIRAAAGGPVVMGAANSAGTTNTKLTTNSTGSAWEVIQNGTGTAVRSSANNGIAGYFGSANGTGVSGVVGHNQKYGVYGANNGASYAGGAGMRADGKKNHGIVATSSDSSGQPVRGVHQATTGAGTAVAGETAAPSGIGVYGRASNQNGTNVGVRGVTNSFQGSGVLGSADLPDGFSGGYGVEGRASDGVGVYGSGGQYGMYSIGGPTGIYASGSSYAGYFGGNVEVTGTLTGAGVESTIDHPLDPANRFLSHALVESSDRKAIYDGTVELDRDGRATVELPTWFEALNGDFRYQLTAIGRQAQAWIAAEISGGRFVIESDSPGARISWQVTGIRRDPFTRAHPIEVERAKTDEERGRYLHPELHGRPKEDGLDPGLARPRPSR